MNATSFYAASALGAFALYFLMRPQREMVRAMFTMAGLAAVGLLITIVAKAAPPPPGVTNDAPFWLYVLMALIAVVGAVRMVTHTKPVYAALYFILVILASAATLLLMQAEFMAFALVIVYAGAILITYLFVLMLAQQSGAQSSHDAGPAVYDRSPREPFYAVIVGFTILATLGDALFGHTATLPWQTPTALVARANARQWRELEAMPKLLRTEVDAVAAESGLGEVTALVPNSAGHVVTLQDGSDASVNARLADGRTVNIKLRPAAQPNDSESLGWALVARFPVSLELAGVILLMAMFGAVVLARKQIEIAEDDRRTAVGLPRLSEHPSGAGGAQHGGTSS